MRVSALPSTSMRLTLFLSLLLLHSPLLVITARVRTPPTRHTLPSTLFETALRQSVPDDLPRVPPQFNVNAGGPAGGRFIAEPLQWIVGQTSFSELPDAQIGGAEPKNALMYNSHRYGLDGAVWGYDIPLMEPGTYGCTLHFAETDAESFAVGKRVFDIVMATNHGDPVVFENIDIFDELDGAQFTVLTKTAENLVIPGVLAIRAIPREGNAMISGITCERTGDLPKGVSADFETDPIIPTAAVVTPTRGETEDSGSVIVGTEINVNAGGPALGRFLAEDQSWIFGETSQWGGPEGVDIGGAEPKNKPALISQRYGTDGATWGYKIPIEMPGIYACSVHFAETDSQSFAKGARVFNVKVMDQVIRRIDVYADSGEAPFTSVVKTFLDLKVGTELVVELKAVTGNSFLSALTCEKTGELDPDDPLYPDESPSVQISETPETSQGTPEESPIVTVPIVGTPPVQVPEIESSAVATPLAESPVAETPPTTVPGDGGLEEVVPSPTPSVPVDIVTVTPAPSTEVEGFESSPQPSIETLSGVADGSPTNAELLDNELSAGDEQRRQEYKLLGKVSGGEFTAEMKDALLTSSKASTSSESDWALITLREENIASVARQDERAYQIDLQALHAEDTFPVDVQGYTKFIRDGDMNSELQKNGIDNLSIELREEPVVSGGGNVTAEASTSSTSVVVGIVVGCVLALLVVVAVGAFVVVRRNRNSDQSANGFDGPPPPMTESEMSSVMERSETGNSIEYLDDDSTFTAATSRAGDHVDQVAFDKDVFGRGTASGSHGVS